MIQGKNGVKGKNQHDDVDYTNLIPQKIATLETIDT